MTAAVTTTGRGRARQRTVLGVVAVLVATVVLGACGGVIGSFVSTQRALSAAGYSKVSVGVAGNDNNIKVSATVDQNTSPGEIREIAAIVWRDFHQRFGALDITLHAADQTVHQVIPFTELQREIGARNPAYNHTSIRNGIIRAGIVVIVVVVVVAIVVVGVVVIVVRRRRRRRLGPPAVGTGTVWPGAGPGWEGGGSEPARNDATPRGGGFGAGPPGDRAPADGASWGAPVSTPAPEDPWAPPPGSAPPTW